LTCDVKVAEVQSSPPSQSRSVRGRGGDHEVGEGGHARGVAGPCSPVRDALAGGHARPVAARAWAYWAALAPACGPSPRRPPCWPSRRGGGRTVPGAECRALVCRRAVLPAVGSSFCAAGGAECDGVAVETSSRVRYRAVAAGAVCASTSRAGTVTRIRPSWRGIPARMRLRWLSCSVRSPA